MWRCAILSGSVILCALGTMASGEAPEYAVGWAKDPWTSAGGLGGKRAGPRDRAPEPARPIIFPPSRGTEVTQFAIPSGVCLTGVVIVPTRTCGEPIRVTLIDGRSEFPLLVPAGDSLVLPFAKGWHTDGCAYLSGVGCRAEDDFQAWGLTDDGPVRFACVHR